MVSASHTGSAAVPSAGPNQNYQMAGSPPPSKQSLGTWWKNFTKANKKDEEAKAPPQVPTGIFSVPLHVSIKYANVAISLNDNDGKTFIYGYVPIVVAKCGVFLKEKAVDVEGIFRLSGSNKRIKELQMIFDSPDRFGKGLDWTGFTVHDAANIFRRYLNMLPEPIVPYEFYEKFRDPLRNHQREAVGNPDAQDAGGFDDDDTIRQYQALITQIPPLNRQLLLYILDLLAVFASKSEINLMPSANLAAIFQPGMLSHKKHDLHPHEYRLSQDVLIYLIENQDHFLIGMKGTAADEKTVMEVQQGGTPPATSTNAAIQGHRTSMGRSSSNASAGAESLRRFGGVRRNVSASSKHSSGAPSPVGPVASSGGGLQRSNTVPSKKSPAIPAAQRFANNTEMSSAGASTEQPKFTEAAAGPPLIDTNQHINIETPADSSLNGGKEPIADKRESIPAQTGAELQVDTTEQPVTTPSKERPFASLFSSKSPTSDGEKKDSKQPNKLRKKRILSGENPSAQSSTNSLHGAQVTGDAPASHAPPSTSLASSNPTDGTSETAVPTSLDTSSRRLEKDVSQPGGSPVTSVHSKTSATDQSDAEHANNAGSTDTKERRHRFRRSTAQPKAAAQLPTSSSNPAALSAESLKGQTSQQASGEGAGSELVTTSTTASVASEHEKRGPIKWIKNKMRESKEERERAKSPPPLVAQSSTQKQSLSAVAENAAKPVPVPVPVMAHPEPAPSAVHSGLTAPAPPVSTVPAQSPVSAPTEIAPAPTSVSAPTVTDPVQTQSQPPNLVPTASSGEAETVQPVLISTTAAVSTEGQASVPKTSP
ncbi:MAG: hypothetical protein M1814_002655 [Vezdaea aestivalis]|nr:MAG: hypothetical protein M1814_002655 [Vezdaea aestivalis]